MAGTPTSPHFTIPPGTHHATPTASSNSSSIGGGGGAAAGGSSSSPSPRSAAALNPAAATNNSASALLAMTAMSASSSASSNLSSATSLSSPTVHNHPASPSAPTAQRHNGPSDHPYLPSAYAQHSQMHQFHPHHQSSTSSSSSSSHLASPRALALNYGNANANSNNAMVSRPATPSSAGSTSVFNLAPPYGSAPAGNGYSSNSASSNGGGGGISAASMGGLALEDVKQWGESQINTWLASHRLSQHGSTFSRNDITGNVLLDVDQNALKEMGIKAVGDRIRIVAAIKALKKRCIDTAQTNRAALARAQERADHAHQARMHAEQLREDAQLLADLNRPHHFMSAAEPDGFGTPITASPQIATSSSAPLPGAAGSESATGPSWRLGANAHSAATLSPSGFSSGSTSGGGLRKGHHSRPPPLRLSGSATSNVSGTPPHPSPSSIAAFNGSQGMGLSQARGLTPGSSRHGGGQPPAHQGRSNPAASSRGAPGTSSTVSSSAAGSALGSPAIGGGREVGGATSPPVTLSHRKTNSAIGSATFLQRNPNSSAPVAQRQFGSYAGQGSSSSGRPSTATGGATPTTTTSSSSSGYVGSNTLGAGSGGGYSGASPTNANFARSTGGSIRPSTADSSGDYSHRQGSFTSGSGHTAGSSAGTDTPLTPITEGNGYSPTTPSATHIHFGNSRSVRGGSVAGVNSSTGVAAPPSLEDLKRRTIKFIGADGTTRIVNVSDCRDAHDVLARVLKKFGKNPASNSYPSTFGQSQASQGDAGTDATNPGSAASSSNDVEKYVIVATSGEGATRDLKPEELLAICHAPQPYDPLRERGLTLRRISPNGPNAGSSSVDSTSRRIARSGRHKLEAFFGDRSFNDSNKEATRDSNTGHIHIHPASPALPSGGNSPAFLVEDPSASAGHVTTAGKKMNRASTVSIMSGLGVTGALNALSGHRDKNDYHHSNNNDYYYPQQQQQQGSDSHSQLRKQQHPHSQSNQHYDRDSSANGSRSASHNADHNTPQTAASDGKSGSGRTSIFPRKARNFMGQRPPSELISSHLADYFPATEKKVLERTARRSIYGRASSSIRSNKRDSTWSFNAVAERDETPPPLPYKSSVEVNRSGGNSPNRMDSSAAPTLPPVVGRTSLDDWSKSLQTVGVKSDVAGLQTRSNRGSRLEIPDGGSLGPGSAGSASSPGAGSVSSGSFNPGSALSGTSPNASFTSPRPRPNRQASTNTTSRASIDSGRSRRSYASQLRAARGIGNASSHRGSANLDRSDAASMLTVDEITQEVESRRESMSILGLSPSEMDEEEEQVDDDNDDDAVGWVVDEDGVPIPIGPQSGGHKSGVTSGRRSMGNGRASASIASRTSRSKGKKRKSSSANQDVTTPTTATTSFSSNTSEQTDQNDDEEEDDEGEEEVYDDSIFKGDSGDDSHGDDGEDSDEDEDDEFSDSDESGIVDVGMPGTTSPQSGAVVSTEGGQVQSGGTDAAATTAVNESSPAQQPNVSAPGVVSSKSSATIGKPRIKWIKGALIGAGSFGSVFLGMNAKNGLLMAVKQVELPSGQSQNDQKKKRMLDALEGEIELLKTLQHENIVQYLDSYADGTHLNIFLEYVPGGSVVALLRNYGAFEEPLVRNFVRQILQGLSFLHNRDIVHRDIKGANILVDNKSCIKISDFGISKKVESDLLANARAHRPSLQGSVFWMAPEVVKQTSYTRKADIWSLGCLVVEMMSGTHPWPNLNQMQALFKIGSSAKPSLPDEISSEAVDFLNLTFELDHEARPSADALLEHAFITEDYTGIASVAAGAGTGGGPAVLPDGASKTPIGDAEEETDGVDDETVDSSQGAGARKQADKRGHNDDSAMAKTPTKATSGVVTTPTKPTTTSSDKSGGGATARTNGEDDE